MPEEPRMVRAPALDPNAKPRSHNKLTIDLWIEHGSWVSKGTCECGERTYEHVGIGRYLFAVSAVGRVLEEYLAHCRDMRDL
jgi:hypothetical protein